MTPRRGRPPLPGPQNLRVYRVRERDPETGRIRYREPLAWTCPDLKTAILNVMLGVEFKARVKWGRRYDEVMREDCPGITERELFQAANALGVDYLRLVIKSPIDGGAVVDCSHHGDDR